MSDQIHILIADDHPLFRDGIVHALGAEPDIIVVGQTSTGEEAFNLTKESLPDVLLMDINMPGEGGIVATQKIAAAFPVVRIIILTVSEDEDDLTNAIKAGADGYVLKGISAKDLANAVRAVVKGETYISPTIAANLIFELSKPQEPDPFKELTQRELEILQLVSEGLTNREVGERLHLAEKTIKHYMTNILQKLHVRSRVEASLIAYAKGRNDQ
jgi:DNA-binding NarL/FixJ family response regulator